MTGPTTAIAMPERRIIELLKKPIGAKATTSQAVYFFERARRRRQP